MVATCLRITSESWEKSHWHLGKFKETYATSFPPLQLRTNNLQQILILAPGRKNSGRICNIFFHMVAHTTLIETKEQLVSRFIGGLHYQIQIAMQQFKPLTISETHQRALAKEIQYRSVWNTWNTRNTTSEIMDPGSASTLDTTQTWPATARPGTPETTNTMLNHDLHVPELSDVFLVGENEHRQTACPHQNQRGLLDQDANFITMIPTCHKIYTTSVLLEIRVLKFWFFVETVCYLVHHNNPGYGPSFSSSPALSTARSAS